MDQIMRDEHPPHRLYRHFSELPYSVRVLFTCVLLILGLGYLFALLNIYFTYAGRAGGNPVMLSYDDIVVAYSGNGFERTHVDHVAARRTSDSAVLGARGRGANSL